MTERMKIVKQTRLGGPLIVQIAVILFLLLLLGGIYIPLYLESAAFRARLFDTWWLWVLPGLPAIWGLWLVADCIVTFPARHCRLLLTDFSVDEEKELIRITFKLDGFPKAPVPAEMLTAGYQLIYGKGGPPIRFRCRQTILYDPAGDLYKITLNAAGFLMKIKEIFIFVKRKRLLPYHCIYKVHRFPYDWRNPRF